MNIQAQMVRRGRWPAVMMVLVLAGCSGPGPDLSMPDPQCRAQAEKDPQVIAAYARSSPNQWGGNGAFVPATNSPQAVIRTFPQLKFASYQRCMRSRGQFPESGVQSPVNPSQPSYLAP